MKNVCVTVLAILAVVFGLACGGEASVQETENSHGGCATTSECAEKCPEGATASCEGGTCYCSTVETVEVPSTCETAANCPGCEQGATASCEAGRCYCTVTEPTPTCSTNADCTAHCADLDAYEALCQADGSCFCREIQRECYGVKRGEFAYRLMRELVVLDGYPAPETPTFPDVPPTHPYYTAIEAAVDYGILDGYPQGGEFLPDNDVNRAEAAKSACMVLEPILDGFEPPNSPSFTDVEPDAWYYVYVEALKARGLTRGYVDKEGTPIGLFGPSHGASSCFLNEIFVEAEFAF